MKQEPQWKIWLRKVFKVKLSEVPRWDIPKNDKELLEERIIEKLKNMKGVPRGRTEKGEPYFDIISFDVEGLVRFIRSLVKEMEE